MAQYGITQLLACSSFQMSGGLFLAYDLCTLCAMKNAYRCFISGCLLTCGMVMAQTASRPADYQLPDLFVASSGKLITTVEEWRAVRRSEILELFRKDVYGRNTVDRPKDMSFVVTDTQISAMNGVATRKLVDIRFSGPHGKGTIHLVLFIPNQRPKEGAPAFLLICNRNRKNIDPDRTTQSDFWPAEQIVSRGYAAAAIYVGDMDPDQDDGFKNGVHGIFDDYPAGQRPGDAWGTIAAWAWGASRVMDYIETDKDLDARRVAVVGHSRGGKTALWCGAQDERFAMVVSNNSGSTGAAIARNKKGESIKQINDQFPHWFCANYKQYNERENDLPVDQHMLLALVAPRLLYVASAAGDDWADPVNEFRSCIYAQLAWRLYNLPGFVTDQTTPPSTPVRGGLIGYHIRPGEHDLKLVDWNHFLDFADQNMASVRALPLTR